MPMDGNRPRGPLKRQARDDVWLIYCICSIPRTRREEAKDVS
jgi:hypothetical protein